MGWNGPPDYEEMRRRAIALAQRRVDPTSDDTELERQLLTLADLLDGTADAVLYMMPTIPIVTARRKNDV